MLTELHLTNFRRYLGEKNVPLRPLTLVYGVNGGGKTALLDAIAIMAQTPIGWQPATFAQRYAGPHLDGAVVHTTHRALPLCRLAPDGSFWRVGVSGHDVGIELPAADRTTFAQRFRARFGGHVIDGQSGYAISAEAALRSLLVGENLLHAFANDEGVPWLRDRMERTSLSKLLAYFLAHPVEQYPTDKHAIRTGFPLMRLWLEAVASRTHDDGGSELEQGLGIDTISQDPVQLVERVQAGMRKRWQNAFAQSLVRDESAFDWLPGGPDWYWQSFDWLFEHHGAQTRYLDPVRDPFSMSMPLAEAKERGLVTCDFALLSRDLRELGLPDALIGLASLRGNADLFGPPKPATNPSERLQEKIYEERVQPRNPTAQVHTSTSDVQLVLQLNGQTSNASELGQGWQQLLPILVQLNTKETKLLLVQQPEVHLHPRVQWDLAGVLGHAVARGKQVICETHSEYLLRGVQRAIRNKAIPHTSVEILCARDEPTTGAAWVDALTFDENGDFEIPWPTDFFPDPRVLP